MEAYLENEMYLTGFGYDNSITTGLEPNNEFLD